MYIDLLVVKVRVFKVNILRWLGYIKRMIEDKVWKRVFSDNVNGKRHRGRPRQS